MGMTDDEREVRQAWAHVIVCDGSYRHYAKGTILINWANHCFHEFKTWPDALAFTDARKEAIRQVEEEIAWIEGEDDENHLREDQQIAVGRIRTRLLATRDEMRKGMKP